MSVSAAVNANLPLFHLDGFNRDLQTADVGMCFNCEAAAGDVSLQLLLYQQNEWRNGKMGNAQH